MPVGAVLSPWNTVLTDAWQVGLEWGAFTRIGSPGGAVTGSGDLAVETKYSFMNLGGSRMHAAFGIEAAFPQRLELLVERRRGREVDRPRSLDESGFGRKGVS